MKTRICVFIRDPLYVGGGEDYAKNLLVGLKERYEVVLVTQYGRLPDDLVFNVRGKLFEALSWLLVRDCDLVIGGTYDSHIPALVAALHMNVPAILLLYDIVTDASHGLEAFHKLNTVEKTMNIVREQFMLRLLARLLANRIAIVGINPQLTRLARKIYRVRAVTIPPGVRYCPERLSPVRERVYDVVYLGRLVRHKRIDVLLQAIRILRSQGLEARTIIVGDGPERARLEAVSKGLGIDDLVAFTGHVTETEKRYILSRSKVYANFSSMEGFGIAMVEAMCHGVVPVVRGRDYPERWILGGLGFYCREPCGAREAATALKQALSSDLQRVSGKVAARARLFTSKKSRERFLRLVELLVK